MDLIELSVLQTADLLRKLKNWWFIAIFIVVCKVIQSRMNIDIYKLLSIGLEYLQS